jgi:hypothetical protein
VPSKPDLVRAAHHEAGHAVGFFTLGLGIELTTIEVDYQCQTAGKTAPRKSGPPLSHAIACLCGPEATKRWAPERLDWRDGAETDLRQAEEFIRAIVDERPSPGPHAHAIQCASLMLSARARAAELVTWHWSTIEIIARALLEQKTLTGATLERLFLRRNL